MGQSTWVKICGITHPDDIALVHAAGANAVGLNFIPRSKRYIDVKLGRELARLARGKLEIVGVVADLQETQIRELVAEVGLDRVQLHGDESQRLIERLGTIAFKGVGIGSEQDVQRAELLPGELLLVDAKIGDLVGGTGTTFDWGLVEQLCRSRRVVVAGGLHEGNVAAAVERLKPFGIDVASGVEIDGHPRRKDETKVYHFVAAVRRAERD